MPKSIYLTDDQYTAVVAYARKCGFRVQRGRGSQLATFIVASAAAAQNNGLQPTTPAAKIVKSRRSGRGG